MDRQKLRDVGLLLIRLGLGAMFIWHGAPKMMAGVDRWERLGRAMAVFGITQVPVVWGFAAAFAEFVGGFLLALGAFTRPACVFLCVTMVVAAAWTFEREGLKEASHAIEVGIVFLGLIFVGPGKLSVDYRMGAGE